MLGILSSCLLGLVEATIAFASIQYLVTHFFIDKHIKFKKSVNNFIHDCIENDTIIVVAFTIVITALITGVAHSFGDYVNSVNNEISQMFTGGAVHKNAISPITVVALSLGLISAGISFFSTKETAKNKSTNQTNNLVQTQENEEDWEKLMEYYKAQIKKPIVLTIHPDTAYNKYINKNKEKITLTQISQAVATN